MSRFCDLCARSFSSRPRACAAFCLVLAVCLAATSAFAQRRAARGARAAAPQSRESGGQTGYGATGYGATGNAANADGAARGADKGPTTFPERTVDESRGPLAEYQKPSYDHHRFVLSPDRTRMALSGRHVEKEPPKFRDTPAQLKRDATGKPIVIANVLEVIDVASGRPLLSFKPPAMFDNLAISPDNTFLAAESPDKPGVINVLHLPTRKSKEFKTPVKRILLGGIVFSRDSRSINVVAPDRLLTIAMGNGETKELKYEFATPAASYSAATNMLAVGVSRSRRGKPEVQIYDVASGKPTEELALPIGPTCLQFSTDGKWLAATVAGGAVGLWQTSDWSAVGSVAGQFNFDAGQLSVSPDGRLVAVRPRMLGGQEMKVIDIQAGSSVQSIATRDVAFVSPGTIAIAGISGPYYMDANTGTLAELPPADASLAITGAAALPFGDPSTQSDAAAPANAQTGYGRVAGQPPSDQPGYGQVSPPQPSDQPGYGQVSPPAASSGGYGSFAPAESPAPAGTAQPTPGADGRR